MERIVMCCVILGSWREKDTGFSIEAKLLLANWLGMDEYTIAEKKK